MFQLTRSAGKTAFRDVIRASQLAAHVRHWFDDDATGERPTIEFCKEHPSAKQALLSWHEEAIKAEWTTPQDIKARYSTARFIGRNRVVFNIKGNDYRFIVALSSITRPVIFRWNFQTRSKRSNFAWRREGCRPATCSHILAI